VSVTPFNTLSRRKERLEVRDPGRISMYVCGPTVYNHIHVGNARAFLVFDVIRRYLIWRGFDVKFVQNYTDIDDKIIAAAEKESRTAEEVAAEYSAAFEDVMKSVGVDPPDVLVKATEYIGEMIEMITQLVDRGFAYESGGNVWYSVEKFPDYGKLSGRRLEELRAGERVEPDPTKRHPLDFALWKAAKPDEPKWASPWGPGRPGWHIECSAMSLKHLGMGFDIHGGGQDLIFPHHENEIAQAEAALGESPFVRYWLHNGLVNIESEKMSKSLGNFVLLKDFIQEVDPQVLRILILSSHYRADIDFTEQQITNARGVLERFKIFRSAAAQLVESGEPGEPDEDYLERFRNAMDDDFHTPGALTALHDLIRRGNVEIEATTRGDDAAKERLGRLLGAFVEITTTLGLELRDDETPPEEVQELIDQREQARRDGRFDEADRIRNELTGQGIVLEDTAAGPRWRRRG
jgi:cysteinyl-tRNA synthetase